MTDLLSVRVAFEEAFRRGLDAVDPRVAVNTALTSGHEIGPIEGPVILLAIGKAAHAMAQGAMDVLEDQVVAGVVVSADASADPACGRLRYLAGGHPIPTAASVRAGRIVMSEAARARGTLLVLISGGASALAEVPLPGLALKDIVTTYRLLLTAGLPIERMNTIRRHLSALKNGGLLTSTQAPTATLMMVDVVGADASAIGSGPTLSDSTTAADAVAVAVEAGIFELLPPAVSAVLQAPTPPSLPSPPHRWAVVADGAVAIRAAAEHLRQSGLEARVDPTPLTGEAAEQARCMASEAVPGTITVRHGETVVKVKGKTRGGRNQHAALAAALALEGQEAAFAALATDGRDGLTDAAGAIIDGGTCGRMRADSLDPEEMLAACRSHDALSASGDLVVTGPTGTNVADIWMSWRRG